MTTITLPVTGGTVSIDAKALADQLRQYLTLPAPAPVPVPVPVPPPATFSVRVKGNQLIDAAGAPLQLRGVNLSGLEFVAIQGWSPTNPWGAQTGTPTPDWTVIKSWKVNAVRIPLNQASWLGLTTYDYSGAARNPDPGANYHAAVTKAVAEATAAGLYVILDLHWSAPKLIIAGQLVHFSPMGQAPMADTSYSVSFWTSVAAAFKTNPAVIFDLFNEPYLNQYGLAAGLSAWDVLLAGGTGNRFPNNTSGGANYDVTQSWQIAGMQSLLDAVRITGATNVVMVAGLDYASDNSRWLEYKPADTLKQLACSVHLYPAYQSTFGTPIYNVPDATKLAHLQAILNARVPVIIGEVGGRNATGTPNEPFVSAVLAWADAQKASAIGWAFDLWQAPDYVLIKDAAGTPTDGFGKVFHDWAVGHG